MNIYGNKIILRAISINDAELLMGLMNDPETEGMLGGKSFPVSLEEQQKWISSQIGKKDILRCIVAEKDNENIGIGTVILSDIDHTNGIAQIHIKMDKQNGGGKGYGLDALKTMINYAFDELRLNNVYAEVLAYNTISQSLFQKAGFSEEGILRSRVFKAGQYIDMYSYSLLANERK